MTDFTTSISEEVSRRKRESFAKTYGLEFINLERTRKMRRTTFEILETYGIEIENDSPSTKFSLPGGFQFTHDASIQTPVKAISGGIRISGEDKLLEKVLKPRKQTHGVEIASNYPLTICDEDIGKIKQVIDQIYLYGGNFETSRCGIHIHITVPKMLKFIKTSLKYFLHLEDVFYYIGGMGQEFRGIHNDAIYCRPITGNGPQVVRCKSPKSFCQVFNVEDLLNSENLDDFQIKYGNILSTGYRGYPPVRYSWINYVTIFRQGSLEYRVFNTTLSSQLLKATIRFCIELTKFLLIETLRPTSKINLEVNSIFSQNSKSDVTTRFIKIAEEIALDDKFTEILLDGINNTPEIVLKDTPVFSHLMFHRGGDKTSSQGYWRGNNYSPKIIEQELVQKPVFQDIHNILAGV